MIICNKPIIWKFINALKKDQSLTEMLKEQLLAGYASLKKKKV